MALDTSDKTSLAIAVVGAVVAGVSAVAPQLSGYGALGATAFIAGGTYFLSHATQPAAPAA